MTLSQAHYLKLTPSQLKVKLTQRVKRKSLHPRAMHIELDKLLEEKKKVRSSKAKQAQHRRLWRELMMPLRAEIKNTKVMLKYQGSDERKVALDGYLMVLEKLLDKLHMDSRKDGFTPASIAKARLLPNSGVHWSDWVPPSVKVKVRELFDAIPKDSIKVKIPFERRVPKAQHFTIKRRLLERTEKELEVAIRKHQVQLMSKDDFEAEMRASETVSNIQQALVWIRESKNTDALPTTWHGFY